MGWDTRREHLHALVVAVPSDLSDLTAALVALEAMADDLEPERERVRLRAEAVATSTALRGRTADTMVAWEAALARGLAERRGLGRPDHRASVAAAAALGAWRWATRHWISGQGSGVPQEPLAAWVRRAADCL